MSLRIIIIRRSLTLIVLVLGCLMLSSCLSLDVTSSDDYIGPTKMEPNAFAPPVGQEPNAPPKPPIEANAPAKPEEQNKTLQITISQATLLALENNTGLVVQRFNPQIKRTSEQQELSVFDPTLKIDYSNDQSKIGDLKSRSNTVDAGVSQKLAAGTTLGLTGTTTIDETASTDEYASQLVFGMTQPLLQGFGTAVNMASVNQARIETKATQYDLRGYVEALVATIEETYWDYALAEKQIQIFTQSLEVAQKQLEETQERINVGKLAQSELAAAEAEVALRKEALISAKSTLDKTKLTLLQLLNPQGSNPWNKEIILETKPSVPEIQLDEVSPHVALAMQMRPELNAAKLRLQKNELQIVKTKNGLLPKLDLFITLGRTGYANSFGDSVKNIGKDNNYSTSAGVNFEFPPLNRAAQAANLNAVISRDQARESLKNLGQLVELDVRNAFLDIITFKEQVAATAATRKLQEEKLRAETEKFRVGKSTSLLVAQAQRDLLQSQINETQAIADYIKSFVQLYKFEGSLLERRGIASPGRQSVKLNMPGL